MTQRGRRKEPLTAGGAPPEPTRSAERVPSVLVVDDNPDVRDMLRIRLSLDGWNVLEATSGDDAIVQWRASQPNVVLLDHQMSEMNGLECAAALRELSADTRIILFTAHLDAAMTEEARRLRILPLRKDDQRRLHDLLSVLAEQLRQSHAPVS